MAEMRRTQFMTLAIAALSICACSKSPVTSGVHTPTVYALEQVQQADAAKRGGNIEAALTHLEKAVADDPGFPQAWRSYGLVLTQTGDQAAALKAFDTLLELRPNYPVAHVIAGLLKESLGDRAAATEHYAAARARYEAMPKSASNKLTAALCIYLEQGKVPGLIAMAEVIDAYPDFHTAHFLLARVKEDDRAYFLRWVGTGTQKDLTNDFNLDALLGEPL